MTAEQKLRRFEEFISPHLPSAFNLARWLVRNREDAEDIVQEAFLRAFTAYESFRGLEGRPWLLAIVRNTALTAIKQKQMTGSRTEFDEVMTDRPSPGPDPESQLVAARDRERVHQAVAELPVEFREAIVLRELEGCSYKEIAAITGVPVGTVMSRLARGRDYLKRSLFHLRKESSLI